MASTTVAVCQLVVPIWDGTKCKRGPQVVRILIEGQYTPAAKLNVQCSESDSFTVLKDNNVFLTSNIPSSLVNVNQSGNYSVICTTGGANGYESDIALVNYQTKPPNPLIRLRASPTTLPSGGGRAVLNWDVLYPGEVQVPDPVVCTLSASPVCTNNTCSQSQINEANIVDQALANPATTDANDPGGANRIINPTAINHVVNVNATTGETDWRAFGKKTLNIKNTTNFLLECGGTIPSQQIRVKVTRSNEG